MRDSGSESSRGRFDSEQSRLVSGDSRKFPGTRGPLLERKSRKGGHSRNATTLLRKRHRMRVIHDGVDVTPRPLFLRSYASVDDKQLTAFEIIGLHKSSSSASQLTQGSVLGSLSSHISSSLVIKSPTLHTTDDFPSESLISIRDSDSGTDEDRAPSMFRIPEFGVSAGTRPDRVTITLRETETIFLFEMPQLTADLRTPEGLAIKEQNERYEYITTGEGSNRKLAHAETQTPLIYTKSRGTLIPRCGRRNQGTFVNNWVMHDVLSAKDRLLERTSEIYVLATEEYLEELKRSQVDRHKLFPQMKDRSLRRQTSEEQLFRIYATEEFREAVRIMERIIAGNLFINAQKKFKGLIGEDPYNLELKFTYSLDLLWTLSCNWSLGRDVSCFRWNYTNENILAVGYGSLENDPVETGLLLIWCMKNPNQPDRCYWFDSQVSDIDWSRDSPNLVAVGFYDGSIKIVDVSSRELAVVQRSNRSTSPTYSPHWQVQFCAGEEYFNYEEQILSSNQDGRIFCYRIKEDFQGLEIMRIPRIEGTIEGVTRTNNCNRYDVPISQNPGALLLRRHPTEKSIYFVGSDEGCLHKCSTNYLQQHIDSFLCHDGPIYSLEFSKFYSKLFLTCGADWCTRIWIEGVTEPLITLRTRIACVRDAKWSPKNSTIIATIVDNEICLWDIKRKTYTPTSVTQLAVGDDSRLLHLEFTRNGNQITTSDTNGVVHVHNLEGLPFPAFDQTQVLLKSVEKALVTKPKLLRKFQKIVMHPDV